MALTALPAHSRQISITAIAGWEADTRHQGFAMAGFMGDTPIQKRLSFAFFTAASKLYYRFPVNSVTVRADSPGAHYLGGFKYSLGHEAWVTALAGGVSRDTEYKGATIEQIRADSGASYMTELQFPLGKRMNFNVLATLNDNDDYGWSRLTLKRQITNLNYSRPWTLNAGAVGTFQGNTQHEAQLGGGLIELYHLPTKVSAAVQGGYKWDSGWGKANYGGISLSKSF